ncbi:hypothetical protein HY968_03840 [Candidatus Kaiserbacteria bacterium]|nr:hypothetical protein [Candidatus Kaiserbacteria bacterium]
MTKHLASTCLNMMLVLMLFSFFLIPQNSAHAQASTSIAPAQTTSGANCGGDPLSNLFCSGSLPEMLNFAFQAAIRLGAVLAMFRIAYAGYLYMGSEDMWSKKSDAKEVFRNAIIGLLILIAVWLILHQIDPRILSLTITGLTPGAGHGVASN